MGNSRAPELLKSHVVYRGHLFRVRRDELRALGGLLIVREVVQHPGAVAILPFLDAQRFVLVSQYRHAVGGTLLEVPAGTLRPGERPLRCARRELEEETGYRAQRFRHVRSFYLAPGYSTEELHLFEARGLKRTEQRLEVDERIRVVPVPQSRLRMLMARGVIRDAKSLVALLPYV